MDFEILPVLLPGLLVKQRKQSKPALSVWVIMNSLVASRSLGIIVKLSFQNFSNCETERWYC